ncbi:hypothetical protein CHUAL_010795 [Chamberlinius hualienensis]
MKSYVLLCMWTLVLSPVFCNRDLYSIIESNPDLSEFYNLIRDAETIKAGLRHSGMTVFAPNNEAWRKFQGTIPKQNLLAYHIVKMPITSDMFPLSAATEMQGGLPVYVYKHGPWPGFSSKADFYANNGLITQTDIKGTSVDGLMQVLHIIDEVLVPTVPNSYEPSLLSPNAYRVLSTPDMYGITDQLSAFESKVNQFERKNIFQGGEGSTFFIPVNGNNAPETWNQVDYKVIDGHIIPNKVYFSRTFTPEAQETLAFNENLKVMLVMKNETTLDGRDYELSVQSKTVIADARYPRGTVVARIVKPNIPVKNGVVHLIENPLVIINKNLLQILQQNSQLRQFYDTLQRNGGDLLSRISSQSDITIFAPTNEAFQRVDASRLIPIITNENSARQMLSLHLVPQTVMVEQIHAGLREVQTFDHMRKLHFGFTYHNVTVTGGGVNSTITTSDIGAFNGVIHIIDQVLGIPYNSIYDKLQTDPSLSTTYDLGTQDNYNEQFRMYDHVFTYFVPHNEGWDFIRTRYTSEYQKLVSRSYSYQVKKILNRHLIVNKRYSLQELVRLGRPVNTVEGTIEVFESNGKYYVRWDGETSEIVDYDVETSNGRVHVIRNVLFKRKDLTTGQAPITTPFLSLFTVLLTALMVIFIL